MVDGGEPGKIDSQLPIIDGQSASKLAVSTGENRDIDDGLLITECKDGALQSLNRFISWTACLT